MKESQFIAVLQDKLSFVEKGIHSHIKGMDRLTSLPDEHLVELIQSLDQIQERINSIVIEIENYYC